MGRKVDSEVVTPKLRSINPVTGFQLPTISGLQFEAEENVGEPREPAPDHRVSRRRVFRSGQVAAQLRDLHKVVAHGALRGRCDRPRHLVEEFDFGRRQHTIGRGVWARPVDHRQTEDAPADDAQDGQQVGQPVGGAEPGLLGLAAGFQDLVKSLYFPSKRVPVQLLDHHGEVGHGEVRQQLPTDRLSALGSPTLLGVDDGQRLRRIPPLPANGRVDRHLAETKIDLSGRDAPAFVPDLDLVTAPDRLARHPLGNRRAAAAGQPVHARPDEEVGLCILGRTKQFEDVAFPIANMDAPGRVSQLVSGLCEVLRTCPVK
jgi:hypothetical protein